LISPTYFILLGFYFLGSVQCKTTNYIQEVFKPTPSFGNSCVQQS